MRKTENLGLMLYDESDRMNITGETDSLNHNMQLIDAAIKQSSLEKIEHVELVRSTGLYNSKYINTNGMLTTLQNYVVTTYTVNEGDIIQIKGAMKANANAALRYAVYSSGELSDSTMVQSGSLNSGGWNDEYDESFTVPTGGIVLAVSSQNLQGVISVFHIYYTYEEKLGNANRSWLSGKKLGILGDSMAKGNGEYDGNCWGERIAAKYKMRIDNQSINGKFLTHGEWSDSVVGGQVDNLSADCDIVVVYAGTNDITAQISIGTYDSVDTTTLNGTMNVLIPKLKNKYPTARILFITPYLRYIRNDDGSYTEAWNNQRDWIMALNEKCNEYGIPCWNNAIQGQIQWNNDAQRRAFTGTDALEFGDDYHLNDNGLNFVADLYEQFMMNPFGNTPTQSVENISDEHIYALIDERLGAIENGTY